MQYKPTVTSKLTRPRAQYALFHGADKMFKGAQIDRLNLAAAGAVSMGAMNSVRDEGLCREAVGTDQKSESGG